MTAIKVLHVVTKHYGGGAALATVRLHNALLSNCSNVNSSILTSHSQSPFTNSSIKHNTHYKLLPTFKIYASHIYTRLLFPIEDGNRSPSIFPSNISSYINNLDIDVVHLHWLQGEFLSIEDIGKITKPIVWTLHDCWPLLSSFHYPKTSSLKTFPQARLHYLSNIDDSLIDFYIKKRKIKSFKNISPSFIFPSQGFYDFSSPQCLYPNSHSYVVDNLLSSDYFELDYNLDDSAPTTFKLLWITAGLPWDSRKGLDILIQSLHILASVTKFKYELVIAGSIKSFEINIPFKVSFLPFTPCQSEVISHYRNSHILLNPSYCETFGYSSAEALVCGIPVVAFNHSGSSSIIEHKSTGYLASPFSPYSFADGIEWVTVNIQLLRSIIFSMSSKSLIPGQNYHQIIADHLDIYHETLCRS